MSKSKTKPKSGIYWHCPGCGTWMHAAHDGPPIECGPCGGQEMTPHDVGPDEQIVGLKAQIAALRNALRGNAVVVEGGDVTFTASEIGFLEISGGVVRFADAPGDDRCGDVPGDEACD